MKTNRVKASLKRGEIVYGVMCMEFATTGIGRLSAGAGAQFAIFDMEHTGWTLETIRMLIATSRSADLLPIVRVPTNDYHHIAHVLDVGAGGIVFPLVRSGTHLREILSYALYPPEGKRGCSFGLSHDDYQVGNLVEGMRSANQSLLTIAQIETVEGLENAEEIVQVEGIDAIWIGQFDLTTSMGIPGQFDHPLFLDASKKIMTACQAANKPLVLGTGDPEQLAAAPKNGFQMLVYTSDLWIYQNALRNCFQKIQSASGNKPCAD